MSAETNFDELRAVQERSEIRKVFRMMFPLAWEADLPSRPGEIPAFLREKLEQEARDRVTHFQQRIVRILCEIAPPKSHMEDMARIVVEEAKKYREAREKYERLAQITAERDEMLERIREIGRIIGCNHTDDPDGRQVLVRCVRESLDEKKGAVHAG